jgi:hypothetical protein
MTRGHVLEILGRHRSELEARGVESLALFGSVARDEATASSDVDLLVGFNRPTGLLAFIELKQYLEDLLGVDRVDLATEASLSESMRRRIASEVIRAN